MPEQNPTTSHRPAATRTEHKPLAKAVNEGRRQAMVHHPTRWPRAVWLRFVARADAKRVPIADVVRECGIAGLGYIETEEAIREHRRATL